MDDSRLYVHFMMLALLGRTAEHLRTVHGTEPTDDKRANAAAHVTAHGVAPEVRWSYRRSRFVTPS